MSKSTFADRCTLAEQCLPDAPYRSMLTKLHGEMLQALNQSDVITRLRGEAGVLRGLLKECIMIIDVLSIEAESSEEQDHMNALINSIHAAVKEAT